MRKILFIGLGFLFFLIVVAVALPLVVDVDRYRPTLVREVNQRINGRLELGKLNLTLWGRARIKVEKLVLFDEKNVEAVSVNDAALNISLWSLLTGAPQVVVKLMQPEIVIIKDSTGQLNLMSFSKGKTAQTKKEDAGSTGPQGGAPENKSDVSPGADVEIPKMVANARISVDVERARILYRDELKKSVSEVSDVDFHGKDISLKRPTALELSARLNVTGPSEAKGQVKLSAEITPKMMGDTFSDAQITFKLDGDELELKQGKVFHKKPGVRLGLNGDLTFSSAELKISKFEAEFLNAKLNADGVIRSYFSQGATPVSMINVRSNPISLEPWIDVLPLLKDKDAKVGGSIEVKGEIKGPMDRLVYSGALDLKNVTAKTPQLETSLSINGSLKVLNEQLEIADLVLKAPGTDVRLTGKVVSFKTPRFNFDLNSSGLDLDQLMKSGPAPSASPAITQAAAPAETKIASPTPKAASDLDLMLEPLRQSDIAKATAGKIKFGFKSIKTKGVVVSNLSGVASLQDLKFTVSNLILNVFGGSVKANAEARLADKTPAYRFSSQISSLDLSQAVASKFPLMKNVIIGKADADLSGEGQSFNYEAAMQNLQAKGSMKVLDAVFGTMDIAKMAGDGISKALEKISDKIPVLKGRKLPMNVGKQYRYEVVSSNFTIAQGNFRAPDLVAKAVKDQGIDLKGNVLVGLKDLSLKTDWEIIDTYDLLKAKNLAVDVNGTKVDHILAEGQGPVKFPVAAGCTALSPCYDYAKTYEYLGKVALGNVAGSMTGKAKAELKKKAEGLIKNAPDSVKKKFEDIGKKFKLFQ